MKKNKKLNYNLAGMLPSQIGIPNKRVDTSIASTKYDVSNALTSVGSLASLIPGFGTVAGTGLNLLGNILGSTAIPTAYSEPNQNTSSYGFSKGGDLKALSDKAVKVKANDPNLTDSVQLPNVNLDNNEVVTKNRVYSDDIVNPMTGNSFAKDEELIQKQLGKFEKYKENTSDTEFKDSKYLNRNSEALFNLQEQVAEIMGMRESKGIPKQNMNLGGYLGGPGDPPELKNAVAPLIVPGDIFFKGATFGNTDFMLNHPNQNNSLYQTLDNSKSSGTIPTIMIDSDDAENYTSLNNFNPDSWKLGNSKEENKTNDPLDFLKALPFGTGASLLGATSNAFSMLGDKPIYVDYENIGQDEKVAQATARQDLIRGRSRALRNNNMQTRVANENVSNRDFNAYQANLRNIASGAAANAENIENRYANMLSQLELNSAQRNTQIQAQNRSKDMQVDQINTQEYDTSRRAKDEKFRNIRRMLIELQTSKNNYNTNEILTKLAGTENFKLDLDSPELYKFYSNIKKYN